MGDDDPLIVEFIERGPTGPQGDTGPAGPGGASAFADLTGQPADNANLAADLALKAPLADPTLTGDVGVPTRAGGDDSDHAASTAFVQAGWASHLAAADPHPQYALESALAPVAASGSAADLTAGTLPDDRLAAVGTAGTYASPASVTTDAHGRVTAVVAAAAAPPDPSALSTLWAWVRADQAQRDGGDWSAHFAASSDYLQPASSTPFDMGSSPFSVAVWVRWDGGSRPGSAAPVCKGLYGGATTTEWALDIGSGGGWYVSNGTAGVNLSWPAMSAPNDRWHLFAVGWDGTNTWAQVDGGARVTAAFAGPVGALSQALYVGRNGAGSSPFAGRIAHLAVWKGRSLTTAEAGALLWNGGRPLPAETLLTGSLGTSLLSYWPLANPAGSTRIDRAGGSPLLNFGAVARAAGPGWAAATDGGKVTSVPDGLSTDRYTQMTDASRPTYTTDDLAGGPGVVGDGALYLGASFGAGTLAVPYTVLAVVRQRQTYGLNQYPVGNRTGAGGILFMGTTGERPTELRAAGASSDTVGAVGLDSHLVQYTVNGASSSGRLDNQPVRSLSLGSAGLDGLTLLAGPGGANPGRADLGDVVVVSGSDAGDIAAARTYLEYRYGVLARTAYRQVVAAGSGSTGHRAFPGHCVLPNGAWAVSFREGTGHISNDGVLRWCLSTDRGVTWGSPVTLFGGGGLNYEADIGLAATAAGTVLLPYWLATGDGFSTPLTSHVGRSTDNGATWSSVNIPVPSGYDWAVPYGRILEPSAGVLLMPAYAQPTGGTRSDSLLYRSTDDGLTWAKFGDIALHGDGPTRDFSETAVERRDASDPLKLVAVVRQHDDEWLYVVFSDDGGATWGAPAVLPYDAPAVSPDLVRLASGGLALSYGCRVTGVKGIAHAVSTDGGATWPTQTTSGWADPLGVDVGYPAFREVSPGRLGGASYGGPSTLSAGVVWTEITVADIGSAP